MSKPYITVGCPTTGGGEVISGHANFKHHGIPIALVGDQATCPKHNTVAVIVSGDPYMSYHGKAVARQGDSLSCGCQLLQKQTTFVRGSDGGEAGRNVLNSFGNPKENSQENFMENKDFEIEIQDLKCSRLIPLKVPNYNGKTFKHEMDVIIKIKKGIYDGISLEIYQDGNFIEVKRINKVFTVGETVLIAWDGFIKNIYNSKFLTSLNGVKMKVKGFSSGAEQCISEKTFKFKYYDKEWIDIVIGNNSKKIYLTLRMSFENGGAQGLDDWRRVPSQLRTTHQPIISATKSFTELKHLAIEGMSYYWSRNSAHPTGKNVTADGQKYEVVVKAIESSSQSMASMKIIYYTNREPARGINSPFQFPLRESPYNTGWLKFESNQFQDTGWRFRAEKMAIADFKETFAHEQGHALLREYGGEGYSTFHKGTSTKMQGTIPNSKYPVNGEIDLMKYAEENKWNVAGYFERMIASEKDVLGLIYLSGICKF